MGDDIIYLISTKSRDICEPWSFHRILKRKCKKTLNFMALESIGNEDEFQKPEAFSRKM